MSFVVDRGERIVVYSDDGEVTFAEEYENGQWGREMGSAAVSPEASQVYHLEAANESGEAGRDVQVEVEVPDEELEVTPEPSPMRPPEEPREWPMFYGSPASPEELLERVHDSLGTRKWGISDITFDDDGSVIGVDRDGRPMRAYAIVNKETGEESYYWTLSDEFDFSDVADFQASYEDTIPESGYEVIFEWG